MPDVAIHRWLADDEPHTACRIVSHGSCIASLLTRASKRHRQRVGSILVPRGGNALHQKSTREESACKKKAGIQAAETGVLQTPPQNKGGATTTRNKATRRDGHGRDPRRRPLGAHVRLPRRARIRCFTDLWKTHARRRRPRVGLGARLCEKVARKEAAERMAERSGK